MNATLLKIMHTTEEWYMAESVAAMHAYAGHQWGNDPVIMQDVLGTDAFTKWWAAEFEHRNRCLVELHAMDKMKPDSMMVAASVVYLFRELHGPESVDRYCSTESHACMIGEVMDEIHRKA